MVRKLGALLPLSVKAALVSVVRGGHEWLSHSVLRIAAASPVLSSLYYLCFSSTFRREHHAVMYGRWRHLADTRSRWAAPFLLRRNIHRLEKGLIMRPRRPVFGTAYIRSTVRSYEGLLSRACAAGGPLPEELVWATHVLDTYFSSVEGHHTIDEARDRFATARGLMERGNGKRLTPYLRDLHTPIPVKYEALLQLAHRRRSVRWFLPRPVDRKLIDKAIAVALLSPSACNRQPYQFVVFDDPDDVSLVGSVPMGTVGFSHNFPVVIAVVGRQRAYSSERDRHVIYIDGSLAAMSFVLALETLGLSSCCINWPDLEPQESTMAKLLRLEPDERVIMLIAVGYPDPNGMVPYSQKMPLEDVRMYSSLMTAE